MIYRRIAEPRGLEAEDADGDIRVFVSGRASVSEECSQGSWGVSACDPLQPAVLWKAAIREPVSPVSRRVFALMYCGHKSLGCPLPF
jgi:hypothetical protein